MSEMALQYSVGLDADFAAFKDHVQFINQSQAAQEKHNQAVAAQAGHEQRIIALKRQETDLLNRAHNLAQAGKNDEAARVSLMASQTAQMGEQLRLQQRMTAEKSKAPGGTGGGSPLLARIGSELAGAGGALLAPLGAVAGGAAIVGTVKGLLSSVVAYTGALKDMSEQSDVTTDELQQSGKALGGVGIGLEKLFPAMERLGAARKAAAEGDEKAQDRFDRFGISLKQLQDPALRTIDLMKMLGKVSKDLNPADRTALSELLGKGGGRMAGALADFSESNGQVGIEAKNIEAIDRLDKASSRWIKSFKAGVANIFGDLIQQGEFVVDFFGRGGVDRPNEPTNEQEAQRRYNRALTQARRPDGSIDWTSANANMGPAAQQYRAFINAQTDSQERLRQLQSQRDAILREPVRQQNEIMPEFLSLSESSQPLSDRQQRRLDALSARLAELRQNEFAAERQAQALTPQIEAAARGAVMTFDQAVERARSGEGPLFNVIKSDTQIANEKRMEALQLSLLSVEKQRQALLEKRAKLMQDIAGMKEGEAKQKKVAEAFEVQGQLAGLANQSAFNTSADEQQKRGIFNGTTTADSQRSGLAELAQLNREFIKQLTDVGVKVNAIDTRVAAFTGQ